MRILKVRRENMASSDYEEEVIVENPNKFKVDSDPLLIGIDNNSTNSVTKNFNNLMVPLIPSVCLCISVSGVPGRPLFYDSMPYHYGGGV